MTGRTSKSLLLSWGLIALSALGLAQVQAPGKYWEKEGQVEFSGEMIVRPVQPATLKALGYTDAMVITVENRARKRMQGITREYVGATDEFIVKIPKGYNENSFSLLLMKSGDYEYAHPNFICYPLSDPNDPLFPQQWHHQTIQAPQAWDIFTGSNNVIVGICDTGVDRNHEDIGPNRVPGYNAVDDKAEVDGGDVQDIHGHGTHTTGDAAAIGNNGKGVSGVGWNFKTMMVRVSNSPGGGSAMDILTKAARYAADHGCRTVSVSYSGVDSDTVGTAGTYCKNVANANLLWAAGNDNRDLSGFSWPDVIVVGASNEADQKAGFSAYGRGVHVFAPGTNIVSTTLGGGYGANSGTSMAAPVANGACALMVSANPALTAQQVQDILESTCDQIGPPSIFGFGRINVFKALQAAAASNPIDTAPDAISVYEGTYMGGTVNDIKLPNVGGAYYSIRTVKSGKTGQTAGAVITWHPDTTKAKVNTFEFFFQTKETPLTLVTAFVYIWNTSTGKWELINQYPITSEFQIKSKKITVNAARFISNSKEVKALVRAVSTTTKGRQAPVPYTLGIGYANLQYTEKTN